MQKITTLLIFLFYSGILSAQIPGLFSYQAVARDNEGLCLSDQIISLRISIVDDSSVVPIVYQEVFDSVATNAQGLFHITIGRGAVQSGVSNLTDLAWHDTISSRSMRVELDPNHGSNFLEVGTTKLLSIPYAVASANGKQFDPISQAELLTLSGANGSPNLRLRSKKEDPNKGELLLFDEDGDSLAWLTGFSPTSGMNAGGLILFGDNGLANLNFSYFPSQGPNRGAMTIRDDVGAAQVQFFVDNNNDGVIQADIKQFIMDHPEQPDKTINYACIEGPEAAAYERGTARLIAGQATVRFSSHFEFVINPFTMTVMTSPWSADSKGLAIVDRSATGFVVKELNGGTGNYSFDWEAKAVRKGWEDYQVIQDKQIQAGNVRKSK